MQTRIKGWALLLIPFTLSVDAGQRLDSHTMDQVTAAGINSNAQLNWIQRDGETLVANDSSASVNITSNVSLDGQVQNNLNTINTINVAATDSVQLLNIAVVDDNAGQVEQLNDSMQDARFVGQLERTLSAGPTIFYRYGRGFSNSLSEGMTEGAVQIDTSLTTTYRQDGYTVVVPKWDPTESFTLSLGNWDTGSFNLGTLRIGGIERTDVGSFGLEASTGPVTLIGPAIDFGSLRVESEDLIIQPGSFRLPGVDFGVASFEACVVGCLEGSVNLGTVGGTNIDPFPDITLEGASPFKGWDLNVGSGIAFIGDGDITMSREASTINVELALDMNKILGPITDLFDDLISSGPIADGFSEVFGVNVSDSLPNLEFPEVTVGTELTIIEALDAQTYSFRPGDDGLCLTFGASDCELTRTITLRSSTEQDGTLSEIMNRTESSQAESWEFEETVVFVLGNMQEVQADIIVTTDSQLTQIKNNSTLLTNQAQRNLSTLNAVNAANAIIGNSSNFITQRSAYSQTNQQRQSNRIVQYR